MKKFTMLIAMLGTVSALAMTTAAPQASAQERFSFSFDTGNVYMGYRDGYYDHDRRWHRWANDRERHEYRARYASRYRDSDRDGIPNRYDRDRDNDGIPNRVDRNPNRPNFQTSRRDWDGDGVPNRYDDFPRNPYRD